jgi:PAS domain S-box-containing protein
MREAGPLPTSRSLLPQVAAVPSNRFLAAIVESSDDAIITKTLDGTITSWNRGAELLYGHTAAEAIGQPISLIIPPDLPNELPSIMERLRRGERVDHYETVRVRKDDVRVDVSVSISPLRVENGRIVGAASIGRDISERKRAERERLVLERQAQQELVARRESEERFRAVWEATSEALALSDPAGVVLAVNPAYCALYGRAAEEFVGHDFALVFPEEDRTEAMAQYREVFSAPDPPPVYEARVQRPDGSERVVEARADFLVRDGERVAMISAIRDVTERKRLDRAQQDFVAMASHDLASPLTVLRARAQLLQRRQTYDEASIAAILEQTDRMERLIGDLRALAQAEGGRLSLQQETLELIELGQAAVERARTLTAEHAIRLEAPEPGILVSGDSDRLGQVLDNLLGNAIKYAPPGGDIVVRVEATGDQARLSVADQGPGIPADALPRLFERFYRGQHTAGDPGLGLGLYISRMLVEAHGGAIRAASRPGAGSIFTVTLPRLGRAASERHTQQNADKSGPKP